MVRGQHGPHSSAPPTLLGLPTWRGGQAPPKAFSRETLFSVLTSRASCHPWKHLPWTVPRYGRNALWKILFFFAKVAKSQPSRPAGMMKQTTDMIKTPRSHGNILDSRPLERWGGTNKAFKPRGRQRDPSLVTEVTGGRFLQHGPERSRALISAAFNPVLQKTQLSPGDTAWCLGGCVASGTTTQIELSESLGSSPQHDAPPAWPRLYGHVGDSRSPCSQSSKGPP